MHTYQLLNDPNVRNCGSIAPLRFHWSLSQAGDPYRRTRTTDQQPGLLSLEDQVALCRQGERFGIESVLMAIGFARPDPILLSAAIGLRTDKIKFMVACRSGLQSPTYFVQQINTLSAIVNGRVCVNIVSGHTPHELGFYGDVLEHDLRYQRTHEFLAICRALWNGGCENFEGIYYRVQSGKVKIPFVARENSGPEIFVGGNSDQALELALAHGHCLWRFPDTIPRLRPWFERLQSRRVGAGLLVSLIVRPTREEALQSATALVARFGNDARAAQRKFYEQSDAKGFRAIFSAAMNDSAWLSPCLWTGAVPVLGAPSVALVGSFEEVASAMLEYKTAGIGQFLFTGWPDILEMEYFGKGVLPIVRKMEHALELEKQNLKAPQC
ncbi:MAG TPA: LLM class flavin-dependent oxidoreductase [Candidatus Angelobacter sp.]